MDQRGLDIRVFDFDGSSQLCLLPTFSGPTKALCHNRAPCVWSWWIYVVRYEMQPVVVVDGDAAAGQSSRTHCWSCWPMSCFAPRFPPTPAPPVLPHVVDDDDAVAAVGRHKCRHS